MFKGSICSRVVYVQGWYLGYYILKDGTYVQGWYMFKGGICSRVVYVQGWYLGYYLLKDGHCLCVSHRKYNSAVWPFSR